MAAAEPRRGRTGADRVDSDPVRCQLVGGVAGEAEQPRLRGAVVGAAAERNAAAGDRGDVDDRAAAARLHMRDHRLHAVERAAQIDRDDPVPIGDRHCRDGLAGDRAGGIDQDVDAARLRRNLGGEPRESRAVGDIERMAGRAAADLGRDALGRRIVAVDHRDPRAGFGKTAHPWIVLRRSLVDAIEIKPIALRQNIKLV